MKNKDLQKLVLSKYEAGQTPKKVFEDLNGVLSYPTVKRRCKMIMEDWRHSFTETILLSQNSSYEGDHTKDQKKIKGR